MKISVYRRQRSAPLRWEWHNHNGVRYVNLTIGHPHRHAWWAFSLFIYY